MFAESRTLQHWSPVGNTFNINAHTAADRCLSLAMQQSVAHITRFGFRPIWFQIYVTSKNDRSLNQC